MPVVWTAPPLRASVPAALVETEAAWTAPPKVVAPLLLTVSAPTRRVLPTAPLKATSPVPLPIVSVWAPSRVLLKVTSLPVVLSATSPPSVTAPV